ncbi:MAG: hypothetical protein ACREV9_12370 [Burkholderiales bacterium]
MDDRDKQEMNPADEARAGTPGTGEDRRVEVSGVQRERKSDKASAAAEP